MSRKAPLALTRGLNDIAGRRRLSSACGWLAAERVSRAGGRRVEYNGLRCTVNSFRRRCLARFQLLQHRSALVCRRHGVHVSRFVGVG